MNYTISIVALAFSIITSLHGMENPSPRQYLVIKYNAQGFAQKATYYNPETKTRQRFYKETFNSGAWNMTLPNTEPIKYITVGYGQDISKQSHYKPQGPLLDLKQIKPTNENGCIYIKEKYKTCSVGSLQPVRVLTCTSKDHCSRTYNQNDLHEWLSNLPKNQSWMVIRKIEGNVILHPNSIKTEELEETLNSWNINVDTTTPQNKIKSLEDQLNNSECRITELTQQIKTLQTEKEENLRKHNELTQQVITLTKEKEENLRKHNELTQQVTTLTKEKEESLRKHNELTQQVITLTKEKEENLRKHNELTQQVITLTKEKEENLRKHNELTQQVITLTKEKEENLRKHNELTQQVITLTKEKEESLRKHNELTQQVITLTKEKKAIFKQTISFMGFLKDNEELIEKEKEEKEEKEEESNLVKNASQDMSQENSQHAPAPPTKQPEKVDTHKPAQSLFSKKVFAFTLPIVCFFVWKLSQLKFFNTIKA